MKMSCRPFGMLVPLQVLLFICQHSIVDAIGEDPIAASSENDENAMLQVLERIDKMEGEMVKLETSNNALNNEIDDLINDKIALNDELDHLKTEVSVLKNEIGVLKNDNNALKTEISDLKNDKNALNDEIDNLKTEVSDLKNNNRALKNEIGDLKNDNSVVKTEISDLKNDNADSKIEINALVETNKDLKLQFETFNVQLEAFANEDLSAETTNEALNQTHNPLKRSAGDRGIRQTFIGPNVAFTAYLSRTWTLVDDGFSQKIKYDQVLLNEGGGYNNETGCFTAPMSGLYLFSWAIMANETIDTFESAFDQLYTELDVNGDHVVGARSALRPDIRKSQGSNLAVLRLSKGDEVSTNSQGFPPIFGSDRYRTTSFSGVLLFVDENTFTIS